MFEKYYEKIYGALEKSGAGGSTVGKIAKQIKHAKSTTWSTLQEMVDRELITRVENYDHTDYKQVRYFYHQLPLPLPSDDATEWECAWCENLNDAVNATCGHCGESADDKPLLPSLIKRARRKIDRRVD